MKHNGEELKPNCFNFAEATQVSLVHHLYKLNSKNRYDDLVRTVKLFTNRIPHNYLSIADDPFGNQICLAIKGENYGKVFFWDHEFEKDEGEPPDTSNMSFIADNFDEFLSTLFFDENA